VPQSPSSEASAEEPKQKHKNERFLSSERPIYGKTDEKESVTPALFSLHTDYQALIYFTGWFLDEFMRIFHFSVTIHPQHPKFNF
jgi:hypothetical protein